MQEKTILCVDDDVDDRFFIIDSIRAINPELRVIEAGNGIEALNYLRKASQKNELPCMVVLDINMPLLDGKETLEQIRSGIGLQALPVVVFTSSESPNDRMLFNSRGVEMISKPADHTGFRQAVRHFLTYCA